MKLFDGIEDAGRGPKATQRQKDFIEDLCDQVGDWSPLERLDKLTVADASELIDELKAEREVDAAPWERDDPYWD